MNCKKMENLNKLKMADLANREAGLPTKADKLRQPGEAWDYRKTRSNCSSDFNRVDRKGQIKNGRSKRVVSRCIWIRRSWSEKYQRHPGRLAMLPRRQPHETARTSFTPESPFSTMASARLYKTNNCVNEREREKGRERNVRVRRKFIWESWEGALNLDTFTIQLYDANFPICLQWL